MMYISFWLVKHELCSCFSLRNAVLFLFIVSLTNLMIHSVIFLFVSVILDNFLFKFKFFPYIIIFIFVYFWYISLFCILPFTHYFCFLVAL